VLGLIILIHPLSFSQLGTQPLPFLTRNISHWLSHSLDWSIKLNHRQELFVGKGFPGFNLLYDEALYIEIVDNLIDNKVGESFTYFSVEPLMFCYSG
jgi:hypothetical protein